MVVEDSMDWDRIRPLLDRCLELSSEARRRFLEREASDAEQAQIERLFAAERRADERGALIANRPGRRDCAEPAEGTRLGPWKLVARLGEGGMGVVWRGQREDGQFSKQVAIKLLKLGLRTTSLEARFRTEVGILAALDHPRIVRLLDGGSTEDGVPYLVLDHVDGQSIDTWCDANRQTIRQRIELFLAVCDAVQHAHERGVLHRDLKPSNILVDSTGAPRLLDFGIAKVVGEMDGVDSLEVTRTGQRLYSPRYASPEQVLGEATSAPSDVFSLGVVLFELVTGRAPYSLTRISQFEFERAALELDAERPSDAVRALAEKDQGDSAWAERGLDSRGGLRAALRGDLDWILLTALRKDPRRRYATVRDLRDDLERFLQQRPVRARPETLGYRARRFVQRNRGVVLSALAVIVTLAIALAVSLALFTEARRSRLEAERTAYLSALDSAAYAIERGDGGVARAHLDAQPEALRGWEWRLLNARADRSLAAFEAAQSIVYGACVAVSEEAGWAAVPIGGGVFWLDLERRQELGVTYVPERRLSGLDAREDGEELAVASGRSVLLIDSRTRSITRTLATGGEDDVYDVSFDPRGARLAWSDRGGHVGVLDLSTGAELARWRAHDSGELALVHSPDGQRLATCSWDETVAVWNSGTGERLARLEGHEGFVADLDWSSDGTHLLSASLDGTVIHWNAESGELVSRVRIHAGVVSGVQFLPGDEEALSCGFRGELLRWRVRDGVVLSRLLGHESSVMGIGLDLSRDLIVTQGNKVRLWNLDTVDVPTQSVCEFVKEIAVAPSGREIACVAPDGFLRRFDARGELLSTLPLWPAKDTDFVGHRTEIAWTDEGLFALDSERDSVALRRFPSGERIGQFRRDPNPELTRELLWVPGLDQMVVLAGELALVDPRDGTRTNLASAEGFTGGHAALSPDGSELATAEGPRVRRRALPEGTLLGDLEVPELSASGYNYTCTEIAYDPARPRLAAVVVDAADADLRVWDLHESRQIARIDDGVAPRALAYHPVDRRLVVGYVNGEIHVFDADSFQRLASFLAHDGKVDSLTFVEDGATLVTCGSEGNVRFWSTE